MVCWPDAVVVAIVTLAGAPTGTGLNEIGTRSVRLPLVSTSEPNAYWFSGAVVTLRLTLKVCVWPGLIVKNCPGDALAWMPAKPSTETVQRVAVESMLLNTRVVESAPPSLLNEIEARLRSFGRSVGTPSP